jgi:hypothetical protein
MRAARFSVPGKVGGNLDVSIIPLPGIAASKLDIVNLWREQVRLKAIEEGELESITEKVQIGELQGELYDMVSTEPMIEEKYKARILVAMVKDDETSWFIKMTGEDESVREQKPVFIEFMKSVSFDYADHRAAPRTTATQREAPTTKPAWQVPPNWKEVAPTEMLLAKFMVPGKGAEQAEVTVAALGGEGGGLFGNVNRWRRQINLPPVTEDELKTLVQPLDLPGGNAMLVDMRGENAAAQSTTRVVVAVVPEGGRTWFYKLMGAESIVEAEKPALINFVKSAKNTNGG